jgi:hypothetical protein
VDVVALAERYGSMQTQDLIALHRAGTLLDEAYPVLESELARRGVSFGPRPAPAIPVQEPPFFAGHWRGLHSARTANGFAARFVPALLALCLFIAYRVSRFFAPESSLVKALPALCALLVLLYLAFAAVAVWRCARNESSAAGTLAARYTGFRWILIFAVGAIYVLVESIR